MSRKNINMDKKQIHIVNEYNIKNKKKTDEENQRRKIYGDFCCCFANSPSPPPLCLRSVTRLSADYIIFVHLSF